MTRSSSASSAPGAIASGGATQPACDGIADCSCTALRRAARRVTQFYDDKLAAAGLRVTQYAILALLHESGCLSVSGIGQGLELDRTSTTKNLGPLQRAGLVQVTQPDEDRRRRVITLTRRGRSTLAIAFPLWCQAQSDLEAANRGRLMGELRDSLAALKIDMQNENAPDARHRRRRLSRTGG